MTAEQGPLRVGALEIDLERLRLLRAGVELKLTRTEWALLRELIKHPEQVLSHRTLLQRVWGSAYGDESDYVHTYISRLRRKLEEDPTDPLYILTEPGLGYRGMFQSDAPSTPAVPAPPLPRPAAPPPPRSINPLPQDVRGVYVGRETERAELRRLLLENTRLIGIYGRGGAGKTALGCAVLGELLEDPDSPFEGMVFLSATGTGLQVHRIFSDFARLLQTSDAALPDDSDASSLLLRITALLDLLRGGDYVLLLDNLEAMQNDAQEIDDPDLATFLRVVLEQGSRLRIVVTSRYPLALPRTAKIWERVIALEAGLDAGDATEMLRRCDPGGEAGLRDAPAAQLAEVARRTRGFPRALQSVAGLLLEDQLLTLDALLADDALFAGEIETVFAQAVLQRLGPELLRALQCLAIFQAPVTLDLFTAFYAPYGDATQARTLLNRLTRAFFASYDREQQTFSLHPTDQQALYASIPAAAAPDGFDRRTLHQRAAELFAARRVPAPWRSLSDATDTLREFEQRLLADEADAAARLLLELDAGGLSLWGHYAELRDAYRRLDGRIRDAALARRALLRLGDAARLLGRTHEAIAAYERALQTDLTPRERGTALASLGWANYDLGRFDLAMQGWQAARDLFAPTHDEEGLGTVLGGLGWVSYLQGDNASALDYFSAALNLFRASGHSMGEAINLGDLGEVHAANGDFAAALAALHDSLALAESLGSRREMSYKGAYLAAALLRAGQIEEAQAVIERAHAQDYLANQAQVGVLRGLIRLRLGAADAARSAFQEAIAAADVQLSYTLGLYPVRYARALAQAGLGHADEAARDYHLATTLCNARGVLQAQLRLLDLLSTEADLSPLRAILLRELAHDAGAAAPAPGTEKNDAS